LHTCRKANKIIKSCRQNYLTSILSESSSDLCKLWETVKRILHPNGDPQITDHDWAQTISQLFLDKAKSVGRLVGADVARQGLNTTPTCVDILADHPKILDTLSPVTVCEVSKLLQSIPNKSNTLDFLPTKLLKDYHTLWAPIITNMVNLFNRYLPLIF